MTLAALRIRLEQAKTNIFHPTSKRPQFGGIPPASREGSHLQLRGRDNLHGHRFGKLFFRMHNIQTREKQCRRGNDCNIMYIYISIYLYIHNIYIYTLCFQRPSLERLLLPQGCYGLKVRAGNSAEHILPTRKAWNWE